MINSSSNAHDRRVASYSPEGVTDRLKQQLHDRLTYYSHNPDRIDERLAQLADEWDIERTLEANASSLILASAAAGYFIDRRFLILTGAVAGFLLQHAIQGFCPPVPLLRQMGVRTRSEIMYEQRALLAIQQDFVAEAVHAGRNDAVAAAMMLDPIFTDE